MKTWTREARYQRLEDVSTAEFAVLTQHVSNAPWRQHYHIQPPTGLLNDPNGFCWDGKQYHLFYQWFPLGAVHGLKYWRGLTSPDLVHFQDSGIAISPDSEYDSHGAYSGSALANPDGTLTIAYTGNHRTADWQRIPYQLTATYDPKHSSVTNKTVFMAGAPQGYTEHVRDPKIWRENGDLYAILGAQRDNHTGTALICKNGVLQGELKTNLPDFGYMWECPDFFPLNDKHVLIISPQGLLALEDGTQANLYQSGTLIGDYHTDTLSLSHGAFQELDYGFDFYAPQTCEGKNGERILIAWMGLPDTAYPSDKDDWQGCLTLPRVLTIEGDKLYQCPLEALKTLRQQRLNQIESLSIGELQLDNPTLAPFTLTLFKNKTHGTQLNFDGKRLTLDRSHSGELPYYTLADIPQGKNTTVRHLIISVSSLQIFIDHSSLEIFINNGEAVMTARIFAPDDANGITYHGEGKLEAWAFW